MNRSLSVPTVAALTLFAAASAGLVAQVAVAASSAVVAWNWTPIWPVVNFGEAVVASDRVTVLPPPVGPVRLLRVSACWVTVVTACELVANAPTAARASETLTPARTRVDLFLRMLLIWGCLLHEMDDAGFGNPEPGSSSPSTDSSARPPRCWRSPRPGHLVGVPELPAVHPG